MMRFRPFVLPPLLALLLLVTGCGAEQSEAPSPTVRTVHAQVVQPRPTVSDRSFSGTLRAPLETNLSFRVAGQVTEVLVKVGEAVRTGETIARLDPEDYRLQVESAKASYQEAKAAAENAKAEFRRIKALYANDNTSLSAYDRARTQYETTQNRAEAAKRQLELARKRLGYTRLTAPASGSIADKMVEASENVAVGQPVARLTSGERLEVKVQVPENLVASLEVGQSASVTTGARGGTVPGIITEVASAPGGQRPTYPVVVTLDRAERTLRSGMSARVAFDFDTQKGYVVPSSAVGRDQSGAFAYVVAPDTARDRVPSADGHIVRRAVETGDLIPSGLVVTSGLDEGDRVVTAGLSHVREGDPVRVSRLLSEN